jgi:hypothetical protein
MLAPPQGDASDDDIRDGYRMLVDQVFPAVRTGAGSTREVEAKAGPRPLNRVQDAAS